MFTICTTTWAKRGSEMLGFCCLLKFLKSTGAERCGGVLFSLSFSAIQHPSPEWSGGDRPEGGLRRVWPKQSGSKLLRVCKRGAPNNKISAKQFLKKKPKLSVSRKEDFIIFLKSDKKKPRLLNRERESGFTSAGVPSPLTLQRSCGLPLQL